MVANSTPLNQFIASNPDYFFDSPVEEGRINPDNLQILVSHVKCAAFELPFAEGETFGGEDLAEILGLPHATIVIEIDATGEQLRVKRELESAGCAIQYQTRVVRLVPIAEKSA